MSQVIPMDVIDKIQTDLDNAPKDLGQEAYDKFKEQAELFHMMNGRAFLFFNRCFTVK